MSDASGDQIPNSSDKQSHSIAEIADDFGDFQESADAEAPALKDQVKVVIKEKIKNLSESIPKLKLRTQPSWAEWFGAKLAGRVLWFIAVAVGIFMLAWWSTMPKVSEVAAALGPNPDAIQLAEAFNKIRAAHTQWVVDLFQPVVVTTLLPIFTLLAGYAFGSQQADQSHKKNPDNNNDDQNGDE